MQFDKYEQEALIRCLGDYTSTLMEQMSSLKKTKHPNKEIIRELEKRKHLLDAILSRLKQDNNSQ
jgi:hypothetical protein